MIISTFKSIHKAYVDLRLDLPWEEMVQVFLHHYDVDKKEDVELYNMVQFKETTDLTVELGRKYHYVDSIKQETYDEISNTVRRCKNNVVAINGIVLDIDEDYNIKDAIELLDGVEYVLYTTFRHTPEKHKFRVVIPFSRPLLADDIASRQQSIIDTFPGVDNASFTVSQSFYFHSGKTDSISYHNTGEMIDPYRFEIQEVKKIEYIQTESLDLDDELLERYRESLKASLYSCSGLHYAGKGDNNNAVLTLVAICRSAKMSFSEFDDICSRIAASDSLLRQPSVRHNAWVSWKADKIRKETRDKFIKDYGGRPLPTRVDKLVQYEETLQEMNMLREKLKRMRNGTD
jgi:hypothetical protein